MPFSREYREKREKLRLEARAKIEACSTKDGITIEAACKKLGIGRGYAYYNSLQRSRKKRAAPEAFPIAESPTEVSPRARSNRLAVIVGDRSQILAVLRDL